MKTIVKKLIMKLQKERPDDTKGRAISCKEFIEVINFLESEGRGLIGLEALVNEGKNNTLFCGHFVYPKRSKG